MNQQQKFTINIVQIPQNSKNQASDCNEIMFINKGATACKVEQFPLAQNEFIVFGGNKDEVCTKVFNITAPAGSALFAVLKSYI